MPTQSILLQPGGAVLPDGSAGNLAPALLRAKGTEASPAKHFLYLAFDSLGNREQVWWTFRMPSDYSSGGTVKLQWMANSTAGDVRWHARLGATSPGDVDTPIEHATAGETGATSTVNTVEGRRLVETSITLANLDGLAPGDFVALLVFRDSSDAADTLTAADAELVAVTFEYTS